MRILQSLLPKLGGDQAFKHRCNPSANTTAKQAAMAMPMQTQVQCRCKHKRNTSANAMETCRHMQTCIHPMQTQVQTQVQPQRQSADAGTSASIGEQATNVPQLFPTTITKIKNGETNITTLESPVAPAQRVGFLKASPRR